MVGGKVMDASGKTTIQWVKVLNTGTEKFTYTDHNGEFKAFAELGDTLTFSLTNFHTKTVVLSALPEQPWTVYLEFDAIELPEVYVMETNENTTIQLDGVNPNQGLQLGNVAIAATEDYRPGVSMAGPISFFSKSERQKRKFLAAEEIRESQQGYLEAIHSDSLRNELITVFSLNRQKFDSLLIEFNAANQHHQFRNMEKERVEKMLFYFINDAVKE